MSWKLSKNVVTVDQRSKDRRDQFDHVWSFSKIDEIDTVTVDLV